VSAIVAAIESFVGSLPLPLLETWGRVAFALGLMLALVAFGGFTFRPGGRWGLGRERQAWDARAVLSVLVTFVLTMVTGYVGSFIVLVPGAQTLESLKDLVVFLCIVLFGYPALLTVPFAYGLSDLIEGVPPELLFEWLPGYFINPACFWIAYQLIGRDPDFRRAATWGRYGVFVLLFTALEPVLWGYICSGAFGPEISYRAITSALLFTPPSPGCSPRSPCSRPCPPPGVWASSGPTFPGTSRSVSCATPGSRSWAGARKAPRRPRAGRSGPSA
jgi:hypothetical protein